MSETGVGIIPTRVGTRCRQLHTETVSRDHPHACGDKSKDRKQEIARAGSSPRVWGQVSPFRRLVEQIKDHPHACGDKNLMEKR